MKKCLIIFTIAIISIIPISKVSASVEYDNTIFPDIVNDGNDSYLIIQNSTGTSNFSFGTWLITYNKEDIKYLSVYNPKNSMNSIYLYLYKDVYNSSSDNYLPITYKAYKLENDTWNLTYDRVDTTNSSNKIITGINKIYFSTENIYIRKDSPDIPVANNENNSTCFGSNRNTYCAPVSESITYSSNNSTDVVVYSPPINIEYLSYEFDFFGYDDYKYYNINFYTDNFNSNYKYQIKFDFQENWVDITNYLSSGSYSYTLTQNCTLYMQVLDEDNESIETKTYTFTDINYSDDMYIPDVDIHVGYYTDYATDLPTARIKLKFNFVSSNYVYKYSFSNFDYNIDINDINDLEYNVYTCQNGTFTIFIYNLDGHVILEKSVFIGDIINSDNLYTYYINISDLYNISDNSLNFQSFHFDNDLTFKNGKTIIPYFYFSLVGDDTKPLDIGIYYDINVNNSTHGITSYLGKINSSSSDVFESYFFPFEMKIDNIPIFTKNTFTYFNFIPYINLNEVNFYDYTTQQIKIVTNIKLTFDDPIKYNGIFSFINYDHNNNSNSSYNSFFRMFSNAFNRFKKVIIEIFKNCTYFFNNSSVILQDFYIVVFTLILFIFLIKFIL